MPADHRDDPVDHQGQERAAASRRRHAARRRDVRRRVVLAGRRHRADHDQRPLDPRRLPGHRQAEGQQREHAMPHVQADRLDGAGHGLMLDREHVAVLRGE